MLTAWLSLNQRCLKLNVLCFLLETLARENYTAHRCICFLSVCLRSKKDRIPLPFHNQCKFWHMITLAALQSIGRCTSTNLDLSSKWGTISLLFKWGKYKPCQLSNIVFGINRKNTILSWESTNNTTFLWF